MRAILAELELEIRQTTRTEDAFTQNLSRLDVDHILPQSWFEHWPLFDESKADWSDIYSVNAKQLAGNPLNEREQAILTAARAYTDIGEPDATQSQC